MVAESGRDYRRSILVGSILLLCELLLTAPADQLTVGRGFGRRPFLCLGRCSVSRSIFVRNPDADSFVAVARSRRGSLSV